MTRPEFQKGDTVRHLIKGHGEVVAVDGDRLYVRWAYLTGHPAWPITASECRKVEP